MVQKLGPYGYPSSWWPGAWEDDQNRRRSFQESISYCVPRLSSVTKIRHFADGDTILEIGAGRGLLAKCLEEQLVKIIPTDIDPKLDSFTQVYKKRHDEAIRACPIAKVLLLAWPSYSAGWPADAVSMFRGDRVIYWGEGQGDSCADDSFFEEMLDHWSLVKQVDVPNWSDFHDYLYFYRRK